MMALAWILVPEFALILLGTSLRRVGAFHEDFWGGLEKLVYFVLFPALLFLSTARARFEFAAAGPLIVVGCGATLFGILLGSLPRILYPAEGAHFGSGAQTAFRFNSYLALAIAERLGTDAPALMAILLGLNVPIANVAAVYGLARTGRSTVFASILRNPLIAATVAGLACNALGIVLPDSLVAILSRLGAASIALGLIAVGAGLRTTAMTVPRALFAWWLGVKLLALPAFALGAGYALHLSGVERQTVVLFAALPTASSAYILAVRMGGNGNLVATLITMGTVLSALSMPLWLVLSQ